MRAAEFLARGSRRIVVGGIAVLVLLGVSGLTAGAASAATDPTVIQLSKDGVVWTPLLKGGLFDKLKGVVPGDSAVESFYVRNPLTTAVTMNTRATNVTSDSAALDNSITVDGSAGGLSLAAPISFASLADCSTLAPDLIIAPKGVAKVSVTLALRDVPGKVAQASHGGFDVLLTMEDNSAGLPATSCNSGPPTSGPGTGPIGGGGGGTHHPHPTDPFTPLFTAGGPLAFTGVSGEVPLLVAGALLALGILLLLARQKRKKAAKS